MRRLLRIVLILVGFLAVGGALLVWLLLRASLPVVSGTVVLAGLASPVTVIRDHAGVPHVFAASPADAARALGFVQAQDRRLQMELGRRAGQGRLAEIAGDARAEHPIELAGLTGWSALDLDRQMRRYGVARIAAAEAELLPAEERVLLQAYADGVNAATDLAGATGTVRLLGAPPEPWTPADSVLFTKLGDLSFAFQRYEELLSAALLSEAGERGLADFFPYPPETVPPLVDGDPHAPAPAAVARLGLPLASLRLIGPVMPGIGSNNWVIGPGRSTTGSPILANDPHVPVSPALYAAHLVAPGLEVIGQVLYGPSFFQGHNAHIAWGVTLVGADTQDNFVEEIAPGDPPRVRTPDGWKPLTVRREEFRVRGRVEPVVDVVREGPHGPLIEDVPATDVARALGVPTPPGASYALALAWTTGTPLAGASLVGPAQAHDWEGFRATLRRYPGIPLNFVYADTDGHIGYQMAGRIPVREGAAPVAPVPGWERGHEWTGTVPFDDLPSLFDPPGGTIATANARITGPHYPHYLAKRWCDLPFRLARIRALLDAKPRLGVDDVAAIQLDVRQDAVKDVVGWATEVASDDPQVRHFQEALRGWDLRADAASMPAALEEALRLELLRGLVAQKLSPELFARYLWINSGIQLLALERILNDESAAFFGADAAAAHAARTAAIEAAMRRAIARLEQTLGPDWSRWSWGRLHTVTFEHPFARGGSALDRVLGPLLNVGPFAAPGSPFTVNAHYWSAGAPFAVWMAPTYRQIVDLGDLRQSRWTPAPPGEAEQVLSRHYADLARPWIDGRYQPMLWARADIEANAESTLTLVPAGDVRGQ